MTQEKATIWDSFLKPIFQTFLINEDEIKANYRAIDWDAECDRIAQPNFTYPDYYRNQNFHGIKGGYLSPEAAITYDPITRYLLPPNENWVRQDAVNVFRGKPRRFLDLGCGTGTTTLLLKRQFPEAEVIGLDLSPYMLAIANYKALQQGLSIQWRHGLAEATGFVPNSFDGITLTLLLHETPTEIAQGILREGFRLLKSGGQIVVLDGNQQSLRQQEWLTNLFEEPYIQAYSRGNLKHWLENTGFQAVKSQDLWWVHQLCQGMKPHPVSEASGYVADFSGVMPA